MNLSSLNRTAAEVAAAALCEIFPGIELLGGSRTSIGFSYDFLASHPLPAEAEVLIEERMRQIVREKREIRVLEMVPVSARGLLEKAGRLARLEECVEGGLVQIIQMGSFYDLSAGLHLENSSQLGAFKLWPIQSLEDGRLRLMGCAFFDKTELKNFLKNYRDYPNKSHLTIGEKKALWKCWDGHVVWLEAGLKWQREIVAILRETLFQGAIEMSLFINEDRATLHADLAPLLGKFPLALAEIFSEPLGEWDPEVGLFSGVGGTQVYMSVFFTSPEEGHAKMISSLQTLRKTLSILRFEHQLRLSGPRRSDKGLRALSKAVEVLEGSVEVMLDEEREPQVECLVEDNLGRQWAAFSMGVASKKFWITASVERLMALLLERQLQNSLPTQRKNRNGE
ncbi:MAG: hypothetical protein HY861_02825 [Chlamydiia bacterium]|nr:hypothetical protein [Chlamydiia bacterium]